MMLHQEQQQQPQQQRPPRSHRANKTSQGTRARNNTKPLLPPPTSDVRMQDPGTANFGFGSDDEIIDAAHVPGQVFDQFPQPSQTQMTDLSNLPFQNRSFNGLLNDVKKQKRRGSKARKGSTKTHGQVTLFRQVKHQQSAWDTSSSHVKENGGLAQTRLKRSTISNRSRSSSKSKGSNRGGDTPKSLKGGSMRRSMNFGKRNREQNSISAENMRFVAQLVNVKSTVPGRGEIRDRDRKNTKLKQNLARSFNGQDGQSLHKNFIQSQNHSRMSSQLSTGSRKGRDKTHASPPKVDIRLKAKGLNNFYKIKSGSPQPVVRASQQMEQRVNRTPDYLKPRKLDSRQLAQMYEADDHLLFGKKSQKQRRKRNSESVASQRSSTHGSVQGSARRPRKRSKSKTRAKVLSGYIVNNESTQETTYPNVIMAESNTVYKMPMPKQQTSNTSDLQAKILSSNQGPQEPIIEHPGPKPNPTGQSLIEKMNRMMTQKSQAEQQVSEKTQSINKQRDAYMRAQEHQYNSSINELGKPPTAKKSSYSKKLSKSIPKNHHSKRKSMQDNSNAYSSHPFAAHLVNPKAALLQGYYQSNFTPAQATKNGLKQRPTTRSNAAGYNHTITQMQQQRNVKTATVRRHSNNGHRMPFDSLPNSHENVSPNSRDLNGSQSKYARTTNNATSTTGKRRIIVAQDRTFDQETAARKTDSGWTRSKRNMTQIEPITVIATKARPGVPLSANVHSKVARDKSRPGGLPSNLHKKPMRAYHDQRKKFLTDKLFSPVLKSQHASSQASVGFEKTTYNTKDCTLEDPRLVVEGDDNRLPEEVVIQGGLRPRVTRTADATTHNARRIRIKRDSNIVVDTCDDQKQDLLPEIIKPKEVEIDYDQQQPLPKNEWLVQNSSIDDVEGGIQTESVSRLHRGGSIGTGVARKSFNDRSAPVVSVVKPAIMSQTQLNVDSQDTFNFVASAHNILQENGSQSQSLKGADATRKAGPNGGLFEAPKHFNQISEEGGDEHSDSGLKREPQVFQHQQTQKLTGVFNIDLEGVEGMSDVKTDRDDTVEEDKAKEPAAADGTEEEETEREEDQPGGLLEEQSEEPAADATLPKNYPRLI